MNRYNVIGIVGEGAYGVVLKCQNRVRSECRVEWRRLWVGNNLLCSMLPAQDSGEYLAVKRFRETEGG